MSALPASTTADSQPTSFFPLTRLIPGGGSVRPSPFVHASSAAERGVSSNDGRGELGRVSVAGGALVWRGFVDSESRSNASDDVAFAKATGSGTEVVG